jgi:caa(3)-type oxidase subunit IV
MSSEHVTSYKTYAVLWVVLLILTVAMILAEGSSMSRAAIVSVILGGMTAKVVLIGGWYMHLRYERTSLIMLVTVATFFSAAALFFLIAPDGMNILRLDRWVSAP